MRNFRPAQLFAFLSSALPGWLLLLTLVGLCLPGFAQTPVEKYGALKVSGNKILDKNNLPVSLAGSSLFWSNAGWGGERFYNPGAVSYVKSDWNATIVRAAMGVEDSGGYLQDKQREKQKVKAVVDAAIAAGMYVIIDWHSHKAENYRSEAVAFFTEMAQTYGTRPNVIFEIYNEPLQVSWSSTIKPYAEAVIGAIRGAGSNNLVVVGTPTWSQRVDEAANDPITRYSNVAYTLHFYAATHKQSLRDIAKVALGKNIALFVTEWGTVDASGGGSVDETSTNEWMTFLKQNNISHLNWALNDKAEAASALKPGASTTGGWTLNNYTPSGLLVRNIVRGWGGSTGGTGNTAPVAVISATPTSETAPVNVQFNASASSDANGDILSFSWTFGDGTTGTGAMPAHTYSAAGSYGATVTVSDGKGGSSQASVTISVTSTTSGGTCKFATPRATPLPTVHQSYKYAHVIGTGGPNLANLTDFTLNWDLANRGLYQFSASTNNGVPNWYVDLIPKTTQTFGSAQPATTISGSGFQGLDGAYWVTQDGANLVLVQKAGSYTIYFSNSATRPACMAGKLTYAPAEALTNGSAQLRVYPVPFSRELNIDLQGIKEVQKIELLDARGQLLQTMTGPLIGPGGIKMSVHQAGNLFLLRITSQEGTFTRTVVRH
jgi:endoglucanase